MNADDMNNASKTDWARIDAMADADIDTSDGPPLSDAFFENAQLQLPDAANTVTIAVDSDTLAWFQSQGESAEQQMAIALKIYAAAHQAYS
jgi:uncharacterized protein (DUF4415 family)